MEFRNHSNGAIPEKPMSKEILKLNSMKKIILSAVFTFATVTILSAQDVNYGVKLGLSNPKLSGFYGEVGHTAKIGFNLGGFVEVVVSDQFSLQPELLFSTQGANTKETEITYKSRLNLNYLNIPIMGKYYLQDYISIEFGPQFGFLVSKKEIYPDEQMYESDESITDYVKNFDLGFNVGGSYDLNEKLSINLRYNIGLSNIFKDDSDEPGDYNEYNEFDGGIIPAKNRVVSLSILYKL
jgi:hypothetical protein